jgi:TolB protein
MRSLIVMARPWRIFAGTLLLAHLALGAGLAFAQVKGTVTEGNINPLRIAVPVFGAANSQDAQLASGVAGVVSADLERSGLFAPLDPASFIEHIDDVNRQPRFADWQAINAQALVVGRAETLPDGRVKAEFRLWDPFTAKQLAGQQFAVRADNWRRLGHIVADAIYERMTGEKGYFDTRVVFIDESGPKDNRVKKLAVMDQDGAGVHVLSQGHDLILTPRFNPAGQQVVFTAYDKGNPHVYMQDLASGQRQVLGNFDGMTFAPRFSPDGGKVLFSLQQGGASSIFEYDIASRQSRQITSSNAIDTGPCYSPDQRQIVFESDRDGTQQMFVMNADGSNQQRISHGDGRYSTPVWSPRGDLIAFTKIIDGRFLIGVMRPDGSGERILTGGFHNEGPTWAPNGRVLMFFRESQGETGGPKLFTIDLTGYNERQIPTPHFGSDPAWSPRIN